MPGVSSYLAPFDAAGESNTPDTALALPEGEEGRLYVPGVRRPALPGRESCLLVRGLLEGSRPSRLLRGVWLNPSSFRKASAAPSSCSNAALRSNTPSKSSWFVPRSSEWPMLALELRLTLLLVGEGKCTDEVRVAIFDAAGEEVVA